MNPAFKQSLPSPADILATREAARTQPQEWDGTTPAAQPPQAQSAPGPMAGTEGANAPEDK